jgi:biotin operon repressor
MTNFLTYESRLARIKYLAEKKQTGNLQELSNKLGTSKRTVKRLISTLRDKGIKIKFCRHNRSYIIEV